MDPSKYDPYKILQAAENKRATNDIQGAHMMFESALLEWVDDAREGAGGDLDQMREAIATLWLAYADFHKSNKKWKSAMDTYEKAVIDPVAGILGRVWLEYARFAEERDKMVTAQNVYLRALVGDGNAPAAVTDDQDASLLWNEFLDMMRKKNPSLSLRELKQAVEKEHVRKQPPPVETTLSSSDIQEQPAKRARIDESIPQPKDQLQLSAQTAPPKTYVVVADDVETEKNMLLDMASQIPPEISAAWMIRDGDSPPTPPEHPLFKPSRPKLSDATGRDLVGGEMALAIVDRLLQDSGTALLETCRGLWVMTALKEKETSKIIENLDKTMMAELSALEANFDARLSVAGPARSAVEQMNANERKAFEQSCSHRRQGLLNKVAWDFRQLLCFQQTILTKMQVPGFEGPTVDSAVLDFQSRVCSLLHVAFFLRKNLGEETHKTTLKSSAARLKRDAANRSPVPRSRTPPPPPSNRTPPRSPPRSPLPPPGVTRPQVVRHPAPIYVPTDAMVFANQQQQQQQQQPFYSMYGSNNNNMPPTGMPPNAAMPPRDVQQNSNMPMMASANAYTPFHPPPYY